MILLIKRNRNEVYIPRANLEQQRNKMNKRQEIVKEMSWIFRAGTLSWPIQHMVHKYIIMSDNIKHK